MPRTEPDAPLHGPADPHRPIRRRLRLRHELLLATAPTAMVLVSFLAMHRLFHQPILFTSLASSAFLIYLDPHHLMNRARVLALAQATAVVAGSLALAWVGPGYLAAALAMATTIISMVTFDIVQPPAVSTALAFSFRHDAGGTALHFALALAMILGLVLLQRFSRWLLDRLAAATRR